VHVRRVSKFHIPTLGDGGGLSHGIVRELGKHVAILERRTAELERAKQLAFAARGLAIGPTPLLISNEGTDDG
jgi:hypothetical protein